MRAYATVPNSNNTLFAGTPAAAFALVFALLVDERQPVVADADFFFASLDCVNQWKRHLWLQSRWCWHSHLAATGQLKNGEAFPGWSVIRRVCGGMAASHGPVRHSSANATIVSRAGLTGNRQSVFMASPMGTEIAIALRFGVLWLPLLTDYAEFSGLLGFLRSKPAFWPLPVTRD